MNDLYAGFVQKPLDRDTRRRDRIILILNINYSVTTLTVCVTQIFFSFT